MRWRAVSAALPMLVVGVLFATPEATQGQVNADPQGAAVAELKTNGTIAFARGGTYDSSIFLVNADSGEPRRLVPGSNPDWSPTGRQLLYLLSVRNEPVSLLTVRADGTRRRVITNDGDSAVWSPDGASIAFHRCCLLSTAQGAIYRVPAAGGQARVVWRPRAQEAGEDVGAGGLAWSPLADEIAFEYMLERRDGPTRKWTDDIFAVSVREPNRTRNITRMRSRSVVHEPSWSPDGRKLLFLHYEGSAGPRAIRVVNASGSNNRRIAWGFRPAWSPDGRSVAFVLPRRYVDGEWKRGDIYVVAPTGGAARKLGPGEEFTWSPDGKRIAYIAAGDLFVMDRNGGHKRRLTGGRSNDTQPDWQPLPGGQD